MPQTNAIWNGEHFRDEHCEHGGSCNPLDRGLTIGRCKSAWLADLVAACELIYMVQECVHVGVRTDRPGPVR